jgi:transketolase
MEAILMNHETSIRRKILEMHYRKQTGHIGSSLSCVEILTAVFSGKVMHDRFIMGKGHAATALYAALNEFGYSINLDDYDGEKLGYHASRCNGNDWSTGSLGHALSVGAGMALAGRATIVVMGDGETDEGSVWEAARFAADRNLNLVTIIDCNGLKGYGAAERPITLEAKFRAFGWHAIIVGGHNPEAIRRALESETRPLAIIAMTVKVKGISWMEGDNAWHYKSPNEEEYKKALGELE